MQNAGNAAPPSWARWSRSCRHPHFRPTSGRGPQRWWWHHPIPLSRCHHRRCLSFSPAFPFFPPGISFPFSPAFHFPHFVPLPCPPLHPASSCSPRRRWVLGRANHPVAVVLVGRAFIVPVPWSPSSSSAPSLSVLVSSRGFVGMAPLPFRRCELLLAAVGCWWPLSLSLPRRPFLSLPVCPCHRPSLS